MESLALPRSFQQSWAEREHWPLNLIVRAASAYPWRLEAFRIRLDESSPLLCLSVEEHAHVPVVDMRVDKNHGISVNQNNISNTNDLSRWLGLCSTTKPEAPQQLELSTNATDPECRLIYIFADHSRTRLRLTREMLVQILTHHQVHCSFLDLILLFGAKVRPRDVGFSGFYANDSLRDLSDTHTIEALNRSGRNFEVSYNLHGVTQISNDKQDPKLSQWSIRQAAVYHKFDIINGNALWILVKGRTDLLDRMKTFMHSHSMYGTADLGNVSDRLRFSLQTHLVYCNWATEDWHKFTLWLEDVLEADSAMAIYDPAETASKRRKSKLYHMEELQCWKDKIRDAMQAIEANIDVLAAVQSFYQRLLSRVDMPAILSDECCEDVTSFISEINEISRNLKAHLDRASLLSSRISDRKTLIGYHLQEQTVNRTERLNVSMEKEALRMRIITVVTLVYLPGTFVSAFFSANVLQYNNSNNYDSSSSNVNSSDLDTEFLSTSALKRWLELTSALTVITIATAWLACQGTGGAKSSLVNRIKRQIPLSPNLSLQWPKIWRLWKGGPLLPVKEDETKQSKSAD